VFLPLARYWLENPASFSYRAFSRIGSSETPLQEPALKILLQNVWNALMMFNWNDGEIWVHSIPYRPALDVVSGALFVLGFVLVLVRYIRHRHWLDLFILLSIPLLQLPSSLSLAFPAENPALNRAGGAMIPVFLLVALALDGMLNGVEALLKERLGRVLSWLLVLGLACVSMAQNYSLVFTQYSNQYTNGAWNSSEMGMVIKYFDQVYGSTDRVWIVPFPNWVDTRLPGVWAGIPNRDFAMWLQDFSSTEETPAPKIFMVNANDGESRDALSSLYPQGSWSLYHSKTKLEGKDFLILFIPEN
jgi:hypothetical protein